MSDSTPQYPQPHRAGQWDAPAPRPKRNGVVVRILVGVISLALVAIGAMVGLDQGRQAGSSVPAAVPLDGATLNSLQIDVGICIESLPRDTVVSTVDAVPCSTPHSAEAVARYTYLQDEWPGRDTIRSEIVAYCGSFVQPGLESDAMFRDSDWDAGVRWVAWMPSQESWNSGDHTALCVVYRDSPMRGSFVKDTVSFEQ